MLRNRAKNLSVIELVAKALEAFDTYDLDAHLDAVDALHRLDEAEIANGLVARFNAATELEDEKSRTLTSAYKEAVGYGTF